MRFMKTYEIVADVTFYLENQKLNGKMIAKGDFENLLSALKWFDSEITDKAELLGTDDYFVVPLYIGKDQNAISKKYYRDVVIKDEELFFNWCC